MDDPALVRELSVSRSWMKCRNQGSWHGAMVMTPAIIVEREMYRLTSLRTLSASYLPLSGLS